MKLNKDKILLHMAKNCMSRQDLAEKAGINYKTLLEIMRMEKCTTTNAGLIAKALNCDVEDICRLEPSN